MSACHFITKVGGSPLTQAEVWCRPIDATQRKRCEAQPSAILDHVARVEGEACGVQSGVHGHDTVAGWRVGEVRRRWGQSDGVGNVATINAETGLIESENGGYGLVGDGYSGRGTGASVLSGNYT